MWTVSLEEFNEGYTHENWLYKNIYTNYSRIYYIIDGQGFCRFQGRTFLLKKNHLYFFPARTYFDLFENIEDKLLHTYIHVCTNPAIDTVVECDVESDAFLKDGVSLLRKYIHAQDYKIISGIVDMILSYVFSQTHEQNPIAVKTKNYIDAHLTQEVTLEQLCEHSNYSKSQLNRLFLNAYKTTPMKYYNDKRLETAVKLLHEGKKVETVCELLQFASPPAFCKAFKQKYGLSPKKYIATVQALAKDVSY
jgi:AraC-like DNA-binding protein